MKKVKPAKLLSMDTPSVECEIPQYTCLQDAKTDLVLDQLVEMIHEINGEIANACLKRSFGHPHHVIIGDCSGRAKVTKCNQTPTIGHHASGPARNVGEREARDVQRMAEVVTAGVNVAALKFRLVGIRNGVDNEIHHTPTFLEPGEDPIQVVVIANVTLQDLG